MQLNKCKLKKINKILIFIAAVSSIAFMILVEYFNGITLDDIGFALFLREHSIFDFIQKMYFEWQGRYTSFLITGIQIKSYFLFGHMLPFSLLLYFLNILLITVSFIRFFNMKVFESILFSTILFQLFVYTYYDISSYFWLCTKPYTLQMTLTIFGASELYKSKLNKKSSYFLLLITSIFVGASYEIFAPLVLLVLGITILFKFYNEKFIITSLLKNETKLVFVFIIINISFLIMVIAPGNWVRMDVHSSFSNLDKFELIRTSALNTLRLAKFMIPRFHYLLLASILLYYFSIEYAQKSRQLKKNYLTGSYHAIFIAFCALTLIFISVLLNTYAIGAKMELRAFNHVNLILFTSIPLSLFFLFKKFSIKRFINQILTFSVLLFILINIYAISKNYKDLVNYKDARVNRIGYLEELKVSNNKTAIKLDKLPIPLFKSVDDLIKMFYPKLNDRVLLKPNEVTYDISNYYNKTYRQYYKLDFEVFTTTYYESE